MAHMTAWYWDRGNFRETNEDSFSLQRVRLCKKGVFGGCRKDKGGTPAAFLLVCDGIGGMPKGEIASGFAAERLTEWFYGEGIDRMRALFWQKKTAQSALAAFEKVQEEIERFEQREKVCIGTTCTMALVKGLGFLLLHTGDSRAYLIGRRERRLTQDHYSGGALRRCLGAFCHQGPDVLWGRMGKKETLLLCTDGFYRALPEGFLKGCFYGDRQEEGNCYKRLKGAANFGKAQGEKDNQTAVLLRQEGRGQDG